MKQVDHEQLNRSKCYYNLCTYEGRVTELLVNPDDVTRYLPPDCGHWGGNWYRLQWIPEFSRWAAVRGVKKDQKSFVQQLEERKVAGPCSICGKWNESRDVNLRGVDCGCHDAWYVAHNGSDAMKEQARQVGLATGSKHIIRYNQSETHRLEVSDRFKDGSYRERAAERLNDSRRQNIARRHGFVDWKSLQTARRYFCEQCGFEDWNAVIGWMRSHNYLLDVNSMTDDIKAFLGLKNHDDIHGTMTSNGDTDGEYGNGPVLDSIDQIKGFILGLKQIDRLKCDLLQTMHFDNPIHALCYLSMNDIRFDSVRTIQEAEELVEKARLSLDDLRHHMDDLLKHSGPNTFEIRFDKGNVEDQYVMLNHFLLSNPHMRNFVTVLFGHRLEDVELQHELCLAVGMNERRCHDARMFMRLGSKRRWDVGKMDRRNWEIKHLYDHYRMVVYHDACSFDQLPLLERHLAEKCKAIYWRPDVTISNYNGTLHQLKE